MSPSSKTSSQLLKNEFTDRPVFAAETVGLLPFGDKISRLVSIPPSRMFIVKRSLQGFKNRFPDRMVYDASQGDGGASLPGVSADLIQRAAEIQIEHGTSYDPPTGAPEFKRTIVEEYWKLDPGLGIGPENIAATVGGRDGLTKTYQAILALGYGNFGDAILVNRVPWISYTWGPAGVGANTLLAPGEEHKGWAITPDAIRESVDFARSNDREIAGLVITSPDNPTGAWLPPATQIDLAKAALEAGIPFVIFDWIYHHVTDQGPMDINDFLFRFEASEREKLVFLDGLTKSLGGSNIRGAHIIAPRSIVQFINAQASHNVIPPFFPQAVTMAALEKGFSQSIQPILYPTNKSRALLKSYLSEQGFRFIMDQGYYAFIEIGDWLDRMGWNDSEALGQYLADQHGLAVVPGVHFSIFGSRWIRFSYATEPEYTLAAAERLKFGLDALK